MKRIGLFGGTFNPVHRGHLKAAREVMDRLSLECVIFIPAAIPPHKRPEAVAAAEDRLEMLRRAIDGEPGFKVSDVELKRSGPSFTIDTVQYFQSFHSKTTRFYFILGLDAFLEMDTWKSYMDLLSTIPMVVLPRPGGPLGDREEIRRGMADFLHSRISADYHLSLSGECFEHNSRPDIFIFDGRMLNLSATSIRERIQRGGDISTLVPTAVHTYIKQKGLYS